jgi:hypothetical protein
MSRVISTFLFFVGAGDTLSSPRKVATTGDSAGKTARATDFPTKVLKL